MNAFLSSSVRLLVRLFGLILHLYPERVRREYAAEMQAVFRLKAEDAAHKSAWALFRLAWREAWNLPLAIASAHLHTSGGDMDPAMPATSDQTPWSTALLGLLPFFIAGPVRIILSFQPAWVSERYSWLSFSFLLLSSLLVISGFVLGAAKNFPRWAYPYAIYLPFLLSALLMSMNYHFHWNDNVQNSFFLFQALILLGLCLPGLRSFYHNIRQDWTLLSYGLYGLVLFIISAIDKDETPHLNLIVLLPTLLTLGAALAHLRIRSVSVRISALLTGSYAGLVAWMTPIIQGMRPGWLSVGFMIFLLMGFASILTAILLAPLLVKNALTSWRAARAGR